MSNSKLNRAAKDKVFKELLKNREYLAQFYFDLTGKRINPNDIVYDTIATSIVKSHEEDLAFQIGRRYIILFEAQSTWNSKDIIRFSYYMFLLFINFIDQYHDSFFDNNKITVPIVEAYVIYTGNDNLPEIVSLDSFYGLAKSMINAEIKIVTIKNAIGLVKQYIEFSKLQTKYYRENKRDRDSVMELINYCIKNNILKNFMISHKSEVTNLIENFFTEERRIQGLINEAVQQERKEWLAQITKKDTELKKMENEIKKRENELKNKEIADLLKLNIKPEKIIDITGYDKELVYSIFHQLNLKD